MFSLLSGGGLTSVGCDAVMLKAFQITVTGVNAYTISLDIGGKVYTPDATATGVGGAVTVLKKGGTTSTWGTTGIADLTEQLRLWIHDNYGEDVITNLYQGNIFYLDKNGRKCFR